MHAFIVNVIQPIKRIMLPLASKQDIDVLQNFATSMAVALPAIFMGLLPWLFNRHIPLWPAFLALILMLLYIFKPSWLYRPYWLWMVVASILGWLNTTIILAFAYYLLIVPTGLVMRTLNKLQYRSFEPQQSTWIKRDKPPTKANLKEPF